MTTAAKFKFLRMELDELAGKIMATEVVTIHEATELFKSMLVRHAVGNSKSVCAAATKNKIHRNTLYRLVDKADWIVTTAHK